MTEEEAEIWEVLDLLTKAEYATGRVAGKAKKKQIYNDLEKVKEKIKEAEVLITPLLDL